MIAILAVNVVLILIAAGIVLGIIPAKTFSGTVAVLHKTVGISLPSPEKERTVAVVWIVSVLVIGDGILLLLIFLTTGVAHS